MTILPAGTRCADMSLTILHVMNLNWTPLPNLINTFFSPLLQFFVSVCVV